MIFSPRLIINAKNGQLLDGQQKILKLLMSYGSNKTFLKQYAKSSYMQKMNPEYEGIAKKYYKQKKEHDKVHHIKDKLDQQVAYIARMQKNMDSKLQKQQRQLQFTKEVSNRFINDLRRREWLNEFKTQTVKNNQKKAQFVKCQSERKLKQAKEYLSQNRRSLANLNRNQNERIKNLKTIRRAQEEDMNKSRASEIYQFKKDLKVHTNQFYQTRNTSTMSNYTKRIQSYKKFSHFDNRKIEELVTLKQNLSNKHKQDKDKSTELSRQIQRVRREAKLESSLVRSRLKSSSSSVSARTNKSVRHQKSNSEYLPGHM